MASTAPSVGDLKAGERLLSALRRDDIPVYAAAWVLDSERDRWTLDVVSDWYTGLLSRSYDVLGRFLAGDGLLAGQPGLRIEDVVPVTRASELGQALVALSPLAGREPRRVGDQFVSGVFIPDAVLYDVAA